MFDKRAAFASSNVVVSGTICSSSVVCPVSSYHEKPLRSPLPAALSVTAVWFSSHPSLQSN